MRLSPADEAFAICYATREELREARCMWAATLESATEVLQFAQDNLRQVYSVSSDVMRLDSSQNRKIRSPAKG